MWIFLDILDINVTDEIRYHTPMSRPAQCHIYCSDALSLSCDLTVRGQRENLSRASRKDVVSVSDLTNNSGGFSLSLSSFPYTACVLFFPLARYPSPQKFMHALYGRTDIQLQPNIFFLFFSPIFCLHLFSFSIV